MISITRGSEPPWLSTSTSTTRYNHPTVAAALMEMQNSKCSYCERYIPPRGLGRQVEHFRPKSAFPEFRYSWTNLLVACPTCNGNKLEQFPTDDSGDPLLLDPSDPNTDPEEHVAFVVTRRQGELGPKGLAIARGDSDRGRETIEVLGLASEHHVKSRGTLLRYLEMCYLQLRTARKLAELGEGDPSSIVKWSRKLERTIRADEEYAGVARCYARETQWSDG